MSDNRFPKANRLVDETDFSRVYEDGVRVDGECFVFYLLETEKPGPRIGIVTPKYLGNAATRNRIKRIIREYFRKNKEPFAGYDFIVRPKKDAGDLENAELGKKFLTDFEICTELSEK